MYTLNIYFMVYKHPISGCETEVGSLRKRAPVMSRSKLEGMKNFRRRIVVTLQRIECKAFAIVVLFLKK